MVTLPKGAKPSKVVGRDETRPQLTQAVLTRDGKDWALFATDSYRFVRLPVEADKDDKPGGISRLAMAAAEKTGRFEAGEMVEPLTKAGGPNGGVLFRRPDEKPPDWVEKWKELQPDRESEYTVALNARFLFEIAQALGAGDVVEITLDTSAELRALTVRPLKGTTLAGEALLMPVRRNA